MKTDLLDFAKRKPGVNRSVNKMLDNIEAGTKLAPERGASISFDKNYGKVVGVQNNNILRAEASTASGDKRPFTNDDIGDNPDQRDAKQSKIVPSDDDMANLKRNFTQTFQSMDGTKKWVLQSGKRAEDALYTFGMKCTTEHICHSFIIDPSDVSYIHHNVFCQAELEEISDTSKKAFPDIPEQLRDYINSFNKNNTTDLRQAILTKQPWDEHYDSITHGDFDWVRNTVYNLVRLYESNDLQHPHLEQWYNMHIWRFFDTIYDGLEQIEVVR